MTTSTASSPSVPSLGWLAAIISLTGLFFLGVGVWFGQWIVSSQFQSQELLVLQLQQELRGIAGDIVRMEDRHGQSLIALHGAIRRLDEQQRIQLTQTVDRAAALERLVSIQLESAQTDESTTLAEFSVARQRRLAVPIDDVDQAIGRLVRKQVNELEVILASLRGHLEAERKQLAALEPILEWETAARSLQTALLPASPFRDDSTPSPGHPSPSQTIATATGPAPASVPLGLVHRSLSAGTAAAIQVHKSTESPAPANLVVNALPHTISADATPVSLSPEPLTRRTTISIASGRPVAADVPRLSTKQPARTNRVEQVADHTPANSVVR